MFWRLGFKKLNPSISIIPPARFTFESNAGNKVSTKVKKICFQKEVLLLIIKTMKNEVIYESSIFNRHYCSYADRSFIRNDNIRLINI